MPALPQFQARTDPSAPLQQRISPEFGQAGPQAMQRAGAAMEMVGERLTESARQNALLQGRIQATDRLGQLRAELESEPDPTRIRERWQTESRAILAEIGRSVPFIARRDFQNFGDLAMAVESRELTLLAARRTTEQAEASLSQRSQQLAQLAAQNPAMREQATAQFNEALAGFEQAGSIRADRAEAMRQRFAGDVAEAAALRAMNANPSGAVRDLMNPSGPYAAMGQERLARMTMQAQNLAESRATRALALAERAERHAERQLRQQQDQNFAGLVRGLQTGDAGVVDQALSLLGRQQLSREHYTFIEGLSTRRDVGRDDPRVELDLQTRMLTQNVQEQIIQARNEGRLSANTAVQMIQRNDDIRRREANEQFASAEEREGFQQVNTLLGGDRPLVQINDSQARRIAAAQREYLDRVRAGENPRAVVLDIEGRYVRNSQLQVNDLATPRFSPRPTTRAEAEAAARALGERHRAGGISRADYEREDALLRDYSTLLPAQQPQQRPAPGQQRGNGR